MPDDTPRTFCWNSSRKILERNEPADDEIDGYIAVKIVSYLEEKITKARINRMYLSDRDLEYAIERGQLIFDPRPETIDTSSIDVPLDQIDEARVWDTDNFARTQQIAGQEPHLMIGKFDHRPTPSSNSGIPRTSIS